MVEDQHTLGDRLRWAIDQQPAHGRERGLRLFQRRMEARGPDVLGTSLSAIQGYLRGAAEPPLPFVRLAAELLDVREAWLAFGEGPPTEPDAVAAEVASDFYGSPGMRLVSGIRERAEEIEEAIQRGAGVRLPLRGWPFLETPEPALIVLLRLWRQRRMRWSAGDRTVPDLELADGIGRAITAPLTALGVKLERLSPDVLEEHVLAMAPILRRAIEEEWTDAEET